ncbi:protein pelota homolog [Octopus sinensis]|uniref:Protein pelota homolog n=1 Tax=Octopus sinensis TaxID=2607531 RepID=A0A6P7TQC1_9MOLL|nr:protein pelota homolog [Octopus sinensis]
MTTHPRAGPRGGTGAAAPAGMLICAEEIGRRSFDKTEDVAQRRQLYPHNDRGEIGAYHTLELGIGRQVTLGKSEWDSYCVERLSQAVNPMTNSDLMAIIMQEGTAYVCLITKSMTIERDKIQVNIPRKRPNFMGDFNKVWLFVGK